MVSMEKYTVMHILYLYTVMYLQKVGRVIVGTRFCKPFT